jgi:phage baseplate assembly protein W
MADRFRSIAYPLGVDASLGRIAEEPDYPSHVDHLIRQVVLTSPGERINRPDFGCGLRRMLFAPTSDASANLARASVLQALDRWLSSAITVDDVTVRAVDARLEVRISYILKVRQERRFLHIEVTP